MVWEDYYDIVNEKNGTKWYVQFNFTFIKKIHNMYMQKKMTQRLTIMSESIQHYGFFVYFVLLLLSSSP